MSLLAQEITRLVASILTEHATLQKKLQQMSKAFPAPCRDVQENAGRLLSKGFIERTPYERLQHFPRYLKAAMLRQPGIGVADVTFHVGERKRTAQ